MLITFSGLDGAGKTTLIEWLRLQLEQRDHRVTVVHFNDHIGVYAGLRALRDRLTGTTRADGPPRLERMTKGWGRVRDTVLWSKTLRRLIYPVDLVIFACYRTLVEKLMRRVLIVDRYFYDRVVDVTDGSSRFWMPLLARLAPTPDLPILLVIDPEEAFARKGEYTVTYLRQRAMVYHALFPLVRTGVWLPAYELDVAKHLLANTMGERLS